MEDFEVWCGPFWQEPSPFLAWGFLHCPGWAVSLPELGPDKKVPLVLLTLLLLAVLTTQCGT
jgi:hypothetical protein